MMKRPTVMVSRDPMKKANLPKEYFNFDLLFHHIEK